MKSLLGAALIALLLGLGIAAFSPLDSCGSWAVRDREAAKTADFTDALAESMTGLDFGADRHIERCEDRYSDRTPIVAILGLLTLIATIGVAKAPGGWWIPRGMSGSYYDEL